MGKDEAAKKEKKSKYKNKKCIIDGIKFDSFAEGDYYLMLKEQKKQGKIKDFDLQPRFIIQDKFVSPWEGNIKAIEYRADFRIYYNEFLGGSYIVDVKGVATSDAKNKRKMFLKVFPELRLRWVSKSLKYGKDGWIDYFKLERIRRENRKKKVLQHSSI